MEDAQRHWLSQPQQRPDVMANMEKSNAVAVSLLAAAGTAALRGCGGRMRALQFVVFLLLACGAHANPSSEQIDFFESKVRPIFAEHCYSCHSEKAEKLKGGLRLDSPD